MVSGLFSLASDQGALSRTELRSACSARSIPFSLIEGWSELQLRLALDVALDNASKAGSAEPILTAVGPEAAVVRASWLRQEGAVALPKRHPESLLHRQKKPAHRCERNEEGRY